MLPLNTTPQCFSAVLFIAALAMHQSSLAVIARLATRNMQFANMHNSMSLVEFHLAAGFMCY